MCSGQSARFSLLVEHNISFEARYSSIVEQWSIVEVQQLTSGVEQSIRSLLFQIPLGSMADGRK